MSSDFFLFFFSTFAVDDAASATRALLTVLGYRKKPVPHPPSSTLSF